MSFEYCWLRICQNEGEYFQTKTGLNFTYSISKNNLIPSRTNHNISKPQIRKVFEMDSIKGPGEISGEIYGSSYIWAILNDSKIKNNPKKSQIKIGMRVEIETKENQGTGKFIEGIVEKVLTSANIHPHGIKIRLVDGNVGRVKKIIKMSPDTNKGANQIFPKFVDLSSKDIPHVEDKDNEFKEFYQYDEIMDNIQKTSEDKKKAIIKEKKQEVQERFATVICSFGNKNGGFVYLGITSNGRIVGLEKDRKLEKFINYKDEFANHIQNKLDNLLKDKPFILSNLKMEFRKIGEKTICLIQVLPSDRPIYLHGRRGQEFYVRGMAPRAQRLEGTDQIKYIMNHFPNL